MSNVQYSRSHRGIVVLDERVSDATVTATEQAGPLPGLAVPSATTALAVAMSGTVTESPALDIRTIRAGLPGVDGASLQWRDDGDTRWNGWDPPRMVTEFEFIERSTTASKWTRPSAVRLATGRCLVAAVEDSTGVSVWAQSSTGVWTEVVVEAVGTTTCVALTVLPSGRVLCYYVVQSEDGTGSAIRMAYSDDDGATFTTGTDFAIASINNAGAASNVVRLRAAYYRGQVLLLIGLLKTGVDYIEQYASSDGGGASFTLVEQFSASNKASADVVATEAGFMVGWIEYDAAALSTYVPKFVTLRSAFTALSGLDPVYESSAGGEWGAYSGSGFTASELAMVVLDDGSVIAYGVNYNAGNKGGTVYTRTTDGGATWTVPSVDSTYIFNAVGAGTAYLRDMAACMESGRVLLAHRAVMAGSADDSLAVSYLGGWTTAPLAESDLGAPFVRVHGWDYTFLPYAEPDSYSTSWSASATGTPTVVGSAQGISVVTLPGEAQSYTLNYGVSTAWGAYALYDVKITAGTMYCELSISDGSVSYYVRVNVTAAALQLYDVHGTANIGASVATSAPATGVQILIALAEPADVWTGNIGQVRAWYRATGDRTAVGPSIERDFIEISNSSTTTASTNATGTCVVSFDASTSGFLRMLGITETYSYPNMVSGAPSRGHAWPTLVRPAHLRGGLRIHATDGPTVQGDAWDVSARYSYPASALDPRASRTPRRGWRSTTTGQNDIVWTGVDQGWLAGDLIAIYVQGATWKTASLYADSSGSTKIADIDLTIKGGLHYARTRDLIYPVAGSANVDQFLPENALAGCKWQYTASGNMRTILANTAGSWRLAAVTDYRPTRLQLASYAGADAASGTTGVLVSDRGLFVTDIHTSTDTLMLRVDSQNSPESEHRLGKVLIGRLVLFSQQYSRGREQILTSPVEIDRMRSGATVTRNPGPMRRAVTFAWVDGSDDRPTTVTNPPNHVTLGYTSAPPVAAYGDVPGTLQGIIRGTKGAHLPCVYVPNLEQPASAPTSTAPLSIVEPWNLLYGSIVTDTFNLSNVVGNEETGEVWRTGVLRIEEEP